MKIVEVKENGRTYYKKSNKDRNEFIYWCFMCAIVIGLIIAVAII